MKKGIKVKKRKSLHNRGTISPTLNDLGAWSSCYNTLNILGCYLARGHHVLTSIRFQKGIFDKTV